MDQLIRLEEELQKSGLTIDYHKFPNCDGFYRAYMDGFEYIAVSPELTETEKVCTAHHEAGHHYTMMIGPPGRDEERANRWAARKLIPIEKIIEALETGAQNKHEIADYLNVTEKFLCRTLGINKRLYGSYVVIGNWVVSFEPTVIAYNYIEDRHRPDE